MRAAVMIDRPTILHIQSRLCAAGCIASDRLGSIAAAMVEVVVGVAAEAVDLQRSSGFQVASPTQLANPG